MKSYTDLEQSKKLAEILPLESADMKWFFWRGEIGAPEMPTLGYSKTAAESYKDTEAVYLPCWSLAALLGVLPYPSLHKTHLDWRCDSYNKEGTACKLGENKNNPIDACYEMIMRLHELKML